MKLLALLLATGVLTACGQTPCECQCYPEKQTALAYKMRVMQGIGPAAATPAEASKVIVCTQANPCPPIPVRVIPATTDKNCQAQLPYCVVCAAKGKDGKGQVDITWELRDKADKPITGYEFITGPDYPEGIEVFHRGKSGKDDFLLYENSNTRFTLRAGTERSDRLAHVARVRPIGSTTPCDPIDPDLVNTN